MQTIFISAPKKVFGNFNALSCVISITTQLSCLSFSAKIISSHCSNQTENRPFTKYWARAFKSTDSLSYIPFCSISCAFWVESNKACFVRRILALGHIFAHVSDKRWKEMSYAWQIINGTFLHLLEAETLRKLVCVTDFVVFTNARLKWL